MIGFGFLYITRALANDSFIFNYCFYAKIGFLFFNALKLFPNVLKNIYTQINSVVFPINMKVSVSFGETYIPANESKQTHAWCK